MTSATASFHTTQRPWRGRERRVNRPADIPSALACAFDHAVARADLDVLLVADEFGTVVANNTTHLDLQELAAVTPIVGRGRALATVRRQGRERELSVRSMHVLGETLYVAALGGDDARHRDREVVNSIAATRRILLS